MFYMFRRTRQPEPGSMALALSMPTTLPIYMVEGRGIGVNWSWRPAQPPQQYYNKTVPFAGIPTIAGQIFGQPLLNPEGF